MTGCISLISKVNSSKWLKVEFNLKKVFVVEFNLKNFVENSIFFIKILTFLNKIIGEFRLSL